MVVVSNCNDRYCPVLKKVIEVGLCYEIVRIAVVPELSPELLPDLTPEDFRNAFYTCPTCDHMYEMVGEGEYDLIKTNYDIDPPPYR